MWGPLKWEKPNDGSSFHIFHKCSRASQKALFRFGGSSNPGLLDLVGKGYLHEHPKTYEVGRVQLPTARLAQ